MVMHALKNYVIDYVQHYVYVCILTCYMEVNI